MTCSLFCCSHFQKPPMFNMFTQRKQLASHRLLLKLINGYPLWEVQMRLKLMPFPVYGHQSNLIFIEHRLTEAVIETLALNGALRVCPGISHSADVNSFPSRHSGVFWAYADPGLAMCDTGEAVPWIRETVIRTASKLKNWQR